MSFLETARLALKSLALQKFRALLTALGVVIGVAAVIAMLSISEGAKRETLEQIRVLGVNNIRLRSVKPVAADRKQEQQQNQNWLLSYGMSRKELLHFKSLSPDIETVVLESGEGMGPFGARGIGEPPIGPPSAAVASAIHDAIGSRPVVLPITPERVLACVDAAGQPG